MNSRRHKTFQKNEYSIFSRDCQLPSLVLQKGWYVPLCAFSGRCSSPCVCARAAQRLVLVSASSSSGISSWTVGNLATREGSDVYSIPLRSSLGGGGKFRVLVELTLDEARVVEAYRQDLSNWSAAIDWTAVDFDVKAKSKIHAWLKAVQLRELGRMLLIILHSYYEATTNSYRRLQLFVGVYYRRNVDCLYVVGDCIPELPLSKHGKKWMRLRTF